MPKGPNGQKRPADAVGAAVMIAKIATGEIEESQNEASLARSKRSGAGGKKRAINLTPLQRSEIAKIAAHARWKKT